MGKSQPREVVITDACSPDSAEVVIPLRSLRQVGWRSIKTGEFCTCPPFEVSPHANSEPVWVITMPTSDWADSDGS